MRRFLIVAVLAVALFAVVAPPVFAQAPTPKVTITGLFDQVTSAGYNFYDGNYSRNNDREWYARTRFRPDFAFQVGRTKAVLGLEIDLTYGQTQAVAGGPGKGGTIGGAANKPGSTSDSTLNIDTAGVIEIKWIYTEFDLTGKDSLLPFIPVPTVARAGGQPFGTLATYKLAGYATGDFAGVSAITTFAPNLKTNFAYVQLEEEVAGANRGAPFTAGAKLTRGNDFALIVSPEYTPFKGLDIKPLYSYFRGDGLTSGSARRATIDRQLGGSVSSVLGAGTAGAAGVTTNALAAWAGAPGYGQGDPALHENRHTIGLDARWRMGPFGFDPTVLYQWGNRFVQAAIPDTTGGGATFRVAKEETRMSAWLVDLVGSYQVGPFLLEVRGIYSTGNDARDNLARRVNYFEVLDADSSYYAGWAQILALGVDYFNGLGGSNGGMVTNVGYDRYGRAQLGFRGTYNMTPALAFYTILSPTWTAKKVDTDTGIGAGGIRSIVSDASLVKGDSRYLGTEWDLGLTWRFAANTAFDLAGGWLFAGAALDTTECVGGPAIVAAAGLCAAPGVLVKRQAQDAWTVASRVRLSF